MHSWALSPITGASLWSAWRLDPLALVAVLAILRWYLRSAASWPRSRTTFLLAGAATWLWVSCGFLEVYGRTLFWVWTVQQLLLLLVVPVLLVAGQPLELARRTRPDGLVVRAVGSRPVRILGNPFVGPILVPIVCFGVLFGPMPGWAVGNEAVAAVLGLGLVLVGALVALPLLDVRNGSASIALGAAMAVGLVELLTDAFPGIVMRFQTRLSSTYFAHRSAQPWSLFPLSDQRRAGGILWGLAELIDLPFLVILFVRWVRSDAREAAMIDAVLDAERASRAALTPEGREPEHDLPWWLSDPRFRDRDL